MFIRKPRLLLAILTLLLTRSVGAQTLSAAAYDCWIGNAGNLYTTHFVRCIVDRDPLGGTIPDDEITLDRIHFLLHQFAIGEVENLVQTNPDLLRSGRVRSVALYSYPAEWSWEAGLPQKLVDSAWCAMSDGCRISMFRR